VDHDTYVCARCGETKPGDEFYFTKQPGDNPPRRSTMCRPCVRQYRKERYDPERKGRYYRRLRDDPSQAALVEHIWGHAAWLRNAYGLSPADHAALMERQGGRCAICDKPPPPNRRLHVDHDHETGRVRGLLCNGCNSGLGALGDDEAGLLRALAYLRARR
jgi:hypothetical protein